MPMINGIKMACEPCIRGHRSTKCNHANERVMLPVRKPGRPLSMCPHQPGSGCSCASVTAAIPRSRKCGCGPKTAASAVPKAPRSPPRRPYPKQPTSPKSLARSRIDPAALGRTDVSHLNIHAPPSSWTGGNPASLDDLALSGGAPGGGGSFMLPAEAMPYYANHAEPTVFFSQASGAIPNGGYAMQSPGGVGGGPAPMYANHGNTEYSQFFGGNMEMPNIATPLGDISLADADLGSFGLSMGSSVPPFAAQQHQRQQQRELQAPAPAPPPPQQQQQHVHGNPMNGLHHSLAFQPSHGVPPSVMNSMAASAATATPAVAPPPAFAAEKRSCCAPAATADTPRHTPTSSTNSLASNAGTANSRSCCSGSPVSSSSTSSQHTMLKSESTSGAPGSLPVSSVAPISGDSSSDAKPGDGTNGAALSMDSTNGAAHMPPPHHPQSAYASLAQQEQHQHQQQQQQPVHGAPVWYRYPPEYGTVNAPLQPSQWRSSLTVTAAPGASSGDLFDDSMQFGGTAALQAPYGMAPGGSGCSSGGGADLHMCACGDDCECIGCVAHPFNNATRNTIQAAFSSLMNDSPSSGASSTTATPTAAAHGVGTGAATQPGGAAATTSTGPETASPRQMPTPSDASGAGSEDQVSLPAADFLFVSYSVMGCDGEGLTCPCGDDCQCVGCTIHNNVPS